METLPRPQASVATEVIGLLIVRDSDVQVDFLL